MPLELRKAQLEAYVATSARHVLHQQLFQQLWLGNDSLLLGTVLKQFPLDLLRQFQQSIRICHNRSAAAPCVPIGPTSQSPRSFDARTQVLIVSMRLIPYLVSDQRLLAGEVLCSHVYPICRENTAGATDETIGDEAYGKSGTC